MLFVGMWHAQAELGTIARTVTDLTASAAPNAETVVSHVFAGITNKATKNASDDGYKLHLLS